MPFHQVDFETGIGPPGPMIDGSRTKPSAGNVDARVAATQILSFTEVKGLPRLHASGKGSPSESLIDSDGAACRVSPTPSQE
jgi:hypothetical protein